VAVWLWLCDAL